MSYPPAPWTLQGKALQTIQLVDTMKVRSLVPQELKIVPVAPGRTLATVYLASYGPGSTLDYNELIVAPALTRYQGKWGFWVSHIYVDNADSMAAGREIWGLPKELAEFTWDSERNRVVVRQRDRLLCTLDYGRRFWLWKQRIIPSVFTLLGSDLLLFKGEVRARLGIAGGHLQVPDESPFKNLGLGRGWLTYHYKEMKFIAREPKVVGQRVIYT